MQRYWKKLLHQSLLHLLLRSIGFSLFFSGRCLPAGNVLQWSRGDHWRGPCGGAPVEMIIGEGTFSGPGSPRPTDFHDTIAGTLPARGSASAAYPLSTGVRPLYREPLGI